MGTRTGRSCNYTEICLRRTKATRTAFTADYYDVIDVALGEPCCCQLPRLLVVTKQLRTFHPVSFVDSSSYACTRPHTRYLVTMIDLGPVTARSGKSQSLCRNVGAGEANRAHKPHGASLKFTHACLHGAGMLYVALPMYLHAATLRKRTCCLETPSLRAIARYRSGLEFNAKTELKAIEHRPPAACWNRDE